MNHPEVLAAPVLLLVSFYLNMLQMRAKATCGHDEHYVTLKQVEKPRTENDLAAGKWFGLRRLIYIVLVTGALVVVDLIASHSERSTRLVLDVEELVLWGFVLASALNGVGRSLTNLLIFKALRQSPGSVTGSVESDYSYLLKVSRYHNLPALLALTVVAILIPSPLTLGFVLGTIMPMVTLYRLERRNTSRTGSAGVVEPPPVIGQ